MKAWTNLAAVVVISAGCSDTAPVASSSKAEPLPPAIATNSNAPGSPDTPRDVPQGITTPPAVVPAAEAAAPPPNPSADPPNPPSAPPNQVPTHDLSQRIRLSAGVALPQTLPEGTTVMISMDYEWVEGAPRHGIEYAWVVELGNGQRVAGSANVSKRRGTIQAILHGVRPDQGPFKGAVFTRTTNGPVPLCNFIRLK